MSQTIQIQIEKSRDLAKGLRKHLNEKGSGVTNEEILKLEQAIDKLKAANDEVDRLREELAPKVKHANEVMAVVKSIYAEKKKMLKNAYPQERWIDYGVPDKR